MPTVKEIVRRAGAPYVPDQCQEPVEALDPGTIGYAGYRDSRARRNGRDPTHCMKQAKWTVDGTRLCAMHAGNRVLRELCEDED